MEDYIEFKSNVLLYVMTHRNLWAMLSSQTESVVEEYIIYIYIIIHICELHLNQSERINPNLGDTKL